MKYPFGRAAPVLPLLSWGVGDARRQRKLADGKHLSRRARARERPLVMLLSTEQVRHLAALPPGERSQALAALRQGSGG